MSTSTSFTLSPLGDTAVLIKAGDSIELAVQQQVQAIAACLEQHPFQGMVEYVPSFTTVTVYYDPIRLEHFRSFGSSEWGSPYEHVCSLLEDILKKVTVSAELHPRTVEIPVCYGGTFGPDLDDVAKHNDLSPEEVIAIHSGAEYIVYMIGFAPGFPYLGGMPLRIAAPRRSSPRLTIPAGTVGIAGNQTGVYPISTPGGWQLIGQTPLDLFRPHDDPPSLLQAGDRVRFVPIAADEFAAWKEGASS